MTLNISRILPFKKPANNEFVRLSQKVEIPLIENSTLYDKILPMQSSLDYMAHKFGVNFRIAEAPEFKQAWIIPNSGFPAIISESKDKAEIAREIYEATSLALKNENQESSQEVSRVRPQKFASTLFESIFKMFKGTLEYYTKIHEDISFNAFAFDKNLAIECVNKSKKDLEFINIFKPEEGYSKIHKMVAKMTNPND